jgi:uncharacterized protein (TIGR02678 family)
MTIRYQPRRDSQRISELQRVQQHDESRRALRALLMRPLMSPGDEDFPAVRRQGERLREWFAREVGWPLHIEREGARLFKRPANLADDTRGLPNYNRQRYVLLCLACAVLERADPQITLKLLGERLMQLASDSMLVSQGFQFTLSTASERRDLVVVCRSLLDFGVLQRVAGDEDSFVRENGWTQSDALYDVQRRMLAGMLAAVRGPSTFRAEDAPADFEGRLHSLVAEHIADSEQGRRDALRHNLARQLLDDPVVYSASLDPEHLAYFTNQRGAMAARLSEAAGLTAEQRAEGVALTDETGELTDISMPAEGTEAHVTLLIAEFLAVELDKQPRTVLISEQAVTAFVRNTAEKYGRYWRKSAREPGAEVELTETALDRLDRLRLITRIDHGVRPMPAISRFALGDPEVRSKAANVCAPEPVLVEP